MHCAVVGAGAWGTALADLLARNGHRTLLWARESDVVDSINARHVNERFLAGAPLSPVLRASAEKELSAGPKLGGLVTVETADDPRPYRQRSAVA